MATISKAFIEEFIELYRNQPALWNTQNQHYKNKNKKYKSWTLLANKYKEVEEDATVDSTKKKINSLRTAYRRELQKMRRSERTAATEDEIYVPTLWYFKNLAFLKDQDSMEDTTALDEDSVEMDTLFTPLRPINIKTETSCINRYFIEELIEMYKNEPSLWNTKCESYKNKKLKFKSWNKLLAKYKEVDAEATVDSVKKKIYSLRSAYRRELQKIRNSEKSGAGPDDVYIPALWYFNSLAFLRKLEERMVDNEEEMEMMDENCSEKPIKSKTPISSKRKYSEIDFLQKAAEHLENAKNQPKRDDADIFGEGWAMMFRKLDESQKIFAKHLIDDSLMYGQLGHLSYNSRICLDSQDSPDSP